MKSGVPGQRGQDQKLVSFQLDERLLRALDDAARGGVGRSAVVREAIYKHLIERGYELPPTVKNAPDRLGKGGRPRKVVEMKKVAEDEAEYRVSKKAAKKRPKS